MVEKQAKVKVSVDGAEQAQSKMAGLANFIKSRFVITFTDLQNVIRSTIGFLGSFVKSSADSEQSISRLNASLKNSGIYTAEVSKELNRYAEELQKVTTFSDEAFRATETILVSIGGLSGDALKQATRATADLAVRLGMDLPQAGQLLAKTLASDVNAFARYGLEINGSVGSAERLSSALTEIARVADGAASTDTETFTGKVKQLENAFDDLKETLGSAVTTKGGLLDFLKNGIIAIDDYMRSISVRRVALMAHDSREINKLTLNELELARDNIDQIKVLGYNKEKALQQINDRIIQIQYRGLQDQQKQSGKKKVNDDAFEEEKQAQISKEKRDKRAEDEKKQREADQQYAIDSEVEFNQAIGRFDEEAKNNKIKLAQEASDALADSTQDGGRSALDFLKRQLNAQVDAWMAAEIGKLSMASFTTFGASLLAIAPTIAAGTAAKAAIGAVKFAQGGTFETQGAMNYQTSSGQTATVGEAGRERVTVDPIGKAKSNNNGQPIIVQLNVDGKSMARMLAPHLSAIDRRVI